MNFRTTCETFSREYLKIGLLMVKNHLLTDLFHLLKWKFCVLWENLLAYLIVLKKERNPERFAGPDFWLSIFYLSTNGKFFLIRTLKFQFYDVLLKNIRICEKFCLLASKGVENREEEISELNKNFQKYKYVFMCFLAEYQSQPFKQHAGKLLLRLDFNNWVHNSIVDLE